MADRILARRHDHAVHAGPFGGARAGAPALKRASGADLLIRPDGSVAMKVSDLVLIRHSGPGPDPVNDAPLKQRTSPERHAMRRRIPHPHPQRQSDKADRIAGQW